MLCSASLVHLAEYQRLKASPRRSGAQRDVILEKRYRCGAPRDRSNRPGKLVRRQSIRRDVEAFDQLDTAAHDERPSQRQEDAAPARCNVPAAVLAALPRELRAHAASRNVWAHVKRRGDAHHLEKPPVDASGWRHDAAAGDEAGLRCGWQLGSSWNPYTLRRRSPRFLVMCAAAMPPGHSGATHEDADTELASDKHWTLSGAHIYHQCRSRSRTFASCLRVSAPRYTVAR
eukprot:CAMPEP_0119362664 /NCGR_PEP_ID=MMETSP1334-20130426/9662_1 /TAXON_ID=127549 /ORGANISM="Calcidiscus leptoporus, Strain RCC1130" /LENGTH=230 /DNA_ID=CAMNT_0007377903 /DNA_START=757 /DNA_END=1450 /DNA_ORIENTATION=-